MNRTEIVRISETFISFFVLPIIESENGFNIIGTETIPNESEIIGTDINGIERFRFVPNNN